MMCWGRKINIYSVPSSSAQCLCREGTVIFRKFVVSVSEGCRLLPKHPTAAGSFIWWLSRAAQAVAITKLTESARKPCLCDLSSSMGTGTKPSMHQKGNVSASGDGIRAQCDGSC